MIDVEDDVPAGVKQPNAATYDSPSAEGPGKRRKVRKGTRSCWECKRRKIRCEFAFSEDLTCIGCLRRRVPCVSQELPEDLPVAQEANHELGERITRVEGLMTNLLASGDGSAVSQTEDVPQQDLRLNTAARKAQFRNSGPSSFRVPLTPIDSPVQFASDASYLQDASRQAENEEALRQLLAAFPGEEDAKILLRESSKPSLYVNLINTQPHSKLTLETLTTPYSIAELPGPNTHPIMLARCMLMFAITLQSPSRENCLGLSESRSVLMRRLVMAATTWVTTKQEMHGTIESLICIILEGIYEINCGNLRRAWVVYRRAMTVAQLMGLHRSPLPPLKRIDPEVDVKPEVLWFRIVYMDRYLSLLLGLPQGTTDKSMGAPSILRHEPPLGRFERQLTVIASRILERNERAFSASEIATTQSIDAELLQISKSMPVGFWRPANFENLTPDSPDTLLETIRLAAQVYYYGLLIQLHLPYMIRVGDRPGDIYSKITCVNASREIKLRFLLHRSFNPTSSCSRPVDFFALSASMTLLLAHIDAHHNRDGTNFLAHQRLSDRAMLANVVEKMDAVSYLNQDIVTEKSANLIRRLLDIEENAAEGDYTATSVGVGDDVQEKRDGSELRLHIPYLGIIKIAPHGPISREPPLGTTTSRPDQSVQDSSIAKESFVGSNKAFTTLPPPASTVEELQLPQPGNANEDCAIPWGLPETEQTASQIHYQSSMLQAPNSTSNIDNLALQPYMELPPAAAGADEWAFQGVDMAFFDSLLRGTGDETAGLESSWMDGM